MWKNLRDDSHVREMRDIQPLFREVLIALRDLRYAEKFFGFWSHLTFTILPTSDYRLSDYRSAIASIEFDPQTEFLLIGFSESGGPWGQWKENGYWVRVGKWAYCDERHAVDLLARLLDRAHDRGEIREVK